MCGDLPAPTALPRGLRLSLQLDRTSVTSGADFRGTIRIRELGPGRFSMDPGQPVQAVVVRTGAQRVVAVYSGGIAGTGYPVNLVRGEFQDRGCHRRDRALRRWDRFGTPCRHLRRRGPDQQGV